MCEEIGLFRLYLDGVGFTHILDHIILQYLWVHKKHRPVYEAIVPQKGLLIVCKRTDRNLEAQPDLVI